MPKEKQTFRELWEEEGAPTVFNDAVREMAEMMRGGDYTPQPGDEIAFDGLKLSDDGLHLALLWATTEGENTRDERILKRMLKAERKERASAIGLACGCWSPTEKKARKISRRHDVPPRVARRMVESKYSFS